MTPFDLGAGLAVAAGALATGYLFGRRRARPEPDARDTIPTDRLSRYEEPYAAYSGDAAISDNDAFLENCRRLVSQIGRSFPNAGIEILLHHLVTPSRSLVAIENAAVTGRPGRSASTSTRVSSAST